LSRFLHFASLGDASVEMTVGLFSKAYKNMKIKYFTDTDTALVEFSGHQVAQTKEINENIYVDLDVDGNLVNMTIEHASRQANISEVDYQQIESKSA